VAPFLTTGMLTGPVRGGRATRTANPPHSRSPPAFDVLPGNQRKSLLAAHARPSHVPGISKTLPQNPTPPDKPGRWGPASSRSDPENQNRKREAERRETDCQFSAPSGAAARSKTERARLSAFHRGSRQPVHYLLTQLQARLPGTRFRRVFPAIFCPSPGSTSRIGHSTDGLMPGAARERVTNSLAGTALAPSIDRRRLRSLSSERDLIIDIIELAKSSKRFRCPNCMRFFSQFWHGRAGASDSAQRRFRWPFLSTPFQRAGPRR
jgi:hypothetical protein